MGFWTIIYSNLPPTLMPGRLRKSVHKAWLRALVTGSVGVLYSAFTVWRSGVIYYLTHNGQVCYMEAMLNDAFDDVPRRIFIDDAPNCEPIYLATDAEASPVYLATDAEASPIYLPTEAEIGASYAGFIVWVPTALSAGLNLPRLAALVNKYRLVSKVAWVVRYF